MYIPDGGELVVFAAARRWSALVDFLCRRNRTPARIFIGGDAGGRSGFDLGGIIAVHRGALICRGPDSTQEPCPAVRRTAWSSFSVMYSSRFFTAFQTEMVSLQFVLRYTMVSAQIRRAAPHRLLLSAKISPVHHHFKNQNRTRKFGIEAEKDRI